MSYSIPVYFGWFVNGWTSLFGCLVECSLDMTVYKLVYLTIGYLPRFIEGVDESQHTDPSTLAHTRQRLVESLDEFECIEWCVWQK